MGCGCKNKNKPKQQTQSNTNTQAVQEAINKTVDKYYVKKS